MLMLVQLPEDKVLLLLTIALSFNGAQIRPKHQQQRNNYYAYTCYNNSMAKGGGEGSYGETVAQINSNNHDNKSERVPLF